MFSVATVGVIQVFNVATVGVMQVFSVVQQMQESELFTLANERSCVASVGEVQKFSATTVGQEGERGGGGGGYCNNCSEAVITVVKQRSLGKLRKWKMFNIVSYQDLHQCLNNIRTLGVCLQNHSNPVTVATLEEGQLFQVNTQSPDCLPLEVLGGWPLGCVPLLSALKASVLAV